MKSYPRNAYVKPRTDIVDVFQHPFIIEVIAFATAAHGEQKQKYTGVPYIEHPLSVARRVAAVGGSLEQIAAAILHDVVEDTKVLLQEIIKRFGPIVGDYVWWLTDAEILKAPDGTPSIIQVMGPKGTLVNANRNIRKAMNREKIAHAPDEVKTIKVADLIDNAHDITAHDPNFSVVYMREKSLALPLLRGANQVLWNEANEILHRYQQRGTTSPLSTEA
jgi:(p)ppGpp synthase/HD superfamily hydrolase